MSHLAEQLAGDDAVLLMYLAGELDPGEHAAVAGRLAADASFSAAFDRVRETDAQFRQGMAALDAATPMPIDPAAAARNVSRAIRQRMAERAAPVQPAAAARHGSRRWKIQTFAAAAAVVIVGSLVWRTLYNGGPVAVAPQQIAAKDAPEMESIERAAASSLMRDTEFWALAGGQPIAAEDYSGNGLLFGLPTEMESAQP